jgi:hypothetical protein
MIRLPIDCSDEDILSVARCWTERLVAEDYAGAFDMLLHVPAYPGKSWVSSPEALRAWIINYGSDEPIPGEPVCCVTPIESAAGKPPVGSPYLQRQETDRRYAGCRGRLDWPLPLNGEWSDLQASFDLVARGRELVFVLVALRVP